MILLKSTATAAIPSAPEISNIRKHSFSKKGRASAALFHPMVILTRLSQTKVYATRFGLLLDQ